MKKRQRMLAAILSACMIALSAGGVIPAKAGTDTNLEYVFGSAVPNEENQLFKYNGSSVTDELDPSTLASSKGTHYLAGNGNFSRFSPAFVWRDAAAGEEPVCYDSNGTPYYVGATPATMESLGLYVDDYYIDGQHIFEKCYARWGYAQQFVLADTKTGELTTAYCADRNTATEDGSYYTIENIEDADYYGDAQARKIRAIAMNGYWGTENGLGSLAAMKQNLAASGQFTDAELGLLTDGVALTATQHAIWHFSNRDSEEVSISAYITEAEREFRRATTEEEKASVDLIFKVYDYLISLDPSEISNTTSDTIINKDNLVTNILIGNAKKIDSHENNLDENPDNDSYTADLSFTMMVLPKSGNGDNLTAKVLDSAGNVLAMGRIAGDGADSETVLESDGNGTYVFEGLTLTEGFQELRIVIEGTQELKQGVYLYTESESYEKSQTLISIAEGTHQVNEELAWTVKFNVNEDDTNDRVIRITKKTSSGLTLEGIQFDVYYAADHSDYVNGKVTLPDADEYAYGDLPDYTLITDADGSAVLNLTENNLPDGVYLIVEREHPAIVAPVDPFYVIIPATNAEGTGYVYEIGIVPKNEVRGNVTIEKDVIEIGNDSSTQDAYEPHTWIIGTSIPADIGQAKSFVISDTLDPRLDFVGNVRVTVENKSGTVIAAALVQDRDYVLTINDVNSLGEGTPSDSFTVSLTEKGMSVVESAMVTGIDRIRVYFDAQINANAQMGTEIPNQATLDYNNSVGVSFHVESDKPKVHTGGGLLLKVDADDNTTVLSGAEFKVYRAATEEEVADDNIVTETIGTMSAPMIAVEFYADPAMEGNKVTTAVSDEFGKVYIYGLAYGEYYAVETKAPAGYNLMTEPFKVTVDAQSHLAENGILVENTQGAVLPETGGPGIGLYMVSGLALMFASGVILLRKRRVGC